VPRQIFFHSAGPMPIRELVDLHAAEFGGERNGRTHESTIIRPNISTASSDA
jgi:hypothetical protein